MPDDAYDAVIIGARIAGATLAALLGDAGYRVLLVDRASFPSSTLSTHYFRGGRAGAMLAQLGLLNDVLALGSPRLVYRYWYRDGSPDATVNYPSHPGAFGGALSVRREPLDQLLVQRACRSAQVELREQTRATALLRDGDRVVGATLATPDGERVVRARIVVGADGRHSFVARAAAAAYEASGQSPRALYYCYVHDFPGVGRDVPDGAEYSWLGDEVAYVFPSDGGATCIALSVNRPTFTWLRQQPLEHFCERYAAHHRPRH